MRLIFQKIPYYNFIVYFNILKTIYYKKYKLVVNTQL